MQLVTYRANGGWEAGVERDGQVTSLAGRYPSIKALLEAGPDEVARVLADPGQGETHSLDSVELGPPVPDPDKIICLGLNYREHAAEGGLKVPDVPVLFTKFRTSLTGPYGEIVLPEAASDRVDYEAELAVVIGRTAKNVSEDEALDYVAGYSCFDDVSARDVQLQTSQWTAGKAIDTFAPMGPGIVPASEIDDVQNLQLKARVNGEVLQDENTREMIFGVAFTISWISRLITLVPGDIIATGTPSGVGFTRKPPILLKEGDVVEIEIEKIGTIRNTVVGSGQRTSTEAATAAVAG
jgi:2-keto-4-pentenoate hydratase/2-oxohepta-3-ene-1,7-dioic acid hydratase in catechol pathway